MKVKVIRGSIKFNDNVYEEGKIVELPENQAISIIKAGNAEEFVQEDAQKEAKQAKKDKKAKLKAKKVKEVKKKEEVKEAEPTLDWTRKELDDFAKSKGIAEPEKFANKELLLEAIKGGEIK